MFLLLALGLMLTGCLQKDKPMPAGQTGYSPQNIVMRLHGSNTIGAKLAPALVRAYFLSLGADTVLEETGANAEERYLRARFGSGEKVVEIWSYGSNTGFNDLAWNKCDIGMSSKPVDGETAQRLTALGDMRSHRNEHVVGLDGIAIIVHPENPIKRLDVATVADLFSGRKADWSRVFGGRTGPVKVYTRDRNSGTFDVFRHSVLGSEPISDSSYVCESNESLAEAVASDPRGIGYVPLGSLGSGKALDIASGEAQALSPAKINIVTEAYPLSRRLFFYTSSQPANPHVKPFIEFAQSEAGQLVVEESGFVAQILRLSKPIIPSDAPAKYASEAGSALRMSIDFRFRPGSIDLDNKARQDLARLARFVERENLRPCALKFFGFCDNLGRNTRNLSLSEHRAKVVAEALRSEYGIAAAKVIGFGSALPIATNTSETGREKNRRIEVWMECSSDVGNIEMP